MTKGYLISTHRQTHEFRCPACEHLASPDRWKDLSRVTIDYCETTSLNRGCAEMADCPAYNKAKLGEPKND